MLKIAGGIILGIFGTIFILFVINDMRRLVNESPPETIRTASGTVLNIKIKSAQTKQEIIDYCTETMLSIGGNDYVLACIKQELKAQEEIEKLSK